MGTQSIFSRGKRSTHAAQSIGPLIQNWTEGVQRAHENGKRVAWGMLGIPTELLDTLGIETAWPENYGTVCAAEGKIVDYLERAESEGFPKDLCSYLRNAFGYSAALCESGCPPLDAPRGGLPYPDMLVTATNTCDPRTKVFQALASKYLDVPIYVCDMQNPAVGTHVQDEDVKKHFISHNYEELLGLVSFLEKQTQRRLDLAKLAEAMKRAYLVRKRFYEVHELRKSVPCPMPSEDIFACIVPILYYPSRKESLDFLDRLYDEVKYRADHKNGVIPNEQSRLIWMGIPTWFNMGIFNYFEEHGAVFVWETTYYIGDPIELDLSDPLRALAERLWMRAARGHAAGGMEVCPQVGSYDGRFSSVPTRLVLRQIQDYRANGVVMHRTLSCRAISFGQTHIRKQIESELQIPVLQIESDMADTRLWSDSMMKTQINAFLELLG